jgi:hypothetical protein
MDRRYLSNGAYWDKRPDWRVNAGSMMSTDLTPFLSTFGGIITYELEKKNIESTYILLFIAWRYECYKNVRVFVQLIEGSETFDWYTTKLEMHYQRYASQFFIYTGPIKNTWLMRDGKMFRTKLELDFTQRDGILNIIISERSKSKHIRKPIWLDPKM